MNPVTLRLMTPDDVPVVLPWRNHPDVRRFMLTRHVISPEEHAAYFERALDDPTKAFYVGVDPGGERCGVVSFAEIDRTHRTATWGAYVRPGAPRGTGSWLMYHAVDAAVERLHLDKLWGDALAFNTVSIHVQQKLGFRIEGVHRKQHVYDGERIDVVRIVMFAEDWTETHKARVRERLAGGAGRLPEGYDVRDVLVPEPDEGVLTALTRLLRARSASVGGTIAAVHLDLRLSEPSPGDLDAAVRVVRRADRDATLALEVRTPAGALVAGGTVEILLPEERP